MASDMAESINLALPCPLSWHHTLSCRAFRGVAEVHGQHWAPLHWLSICPHWPYYISSWEDFAAWLRSSISGRNTSSDQELMFGGGQELGDKSVPPACWRVLFNWVHCWFGLVWGCMYKCVCICVSMCLCVPVPICLCVCSVCLCVYVFMCVCVLCADMWCSLL